MWMNDDLTKTEYFYNGLIHYHEYLIISKWTYNNYIILEININD